MDLSTKNLSAELTTKLKSKATNSDCHIWGLFILSRSCQLLPLSPSPMKPVGIPIDNICKLLKAEYGLVWEWTTPVAHGIEASGILWKHTASHNEKPGKFLSWLWLGLRKRASLIKYSTAFFITKSYPTWKRHYQKLSYLGKENFSQGKVLGPSNLT